MRTFNNKIGQKFIDTVYKYQPIGQRKLQGVIGLYDKTFRSWLKRLIAYNILEKNLEDNIQLTKAAKEKYELAGTSSSLPLDDRRRTSKKHNTITKTRTERKRATNDSRNIEKIERRVNINLKIITMAALGAGIPKRFSKAKPGCIVQTEIFKQKGIFKQRPVFLATQNLPGIGIADLVRKRRGRGANYLLDRRNFPNAEIFGYINLTKSEAEEQIKELENHSPPILKLIGSRYKKPRYGIADPLLQEFIRDCMVLHGEVRKKIEDVRSYERPEIKKDEIEWYNRLYGKQGTGKAGRFYLWLEERRKEFRGMEKKNRPKAIKHKDSWIAHDGEMIKETYYNVLMSKKYHETCIKYKMILEPLMDVIYPKFLRDSIG